MDTPTATYYTGNGRPDRVKVSTNYSQNPYWYVPSDRGLRRLMNMVVNAIMVMGVVFAMVNIILGIIIITQSSGSRQDTSKSLEVLQQVDVNAATTKQLISENIEPKIRSILDSVSFQLPKLLSSLLGPGKPEPPGIGPTENPYQFTPNHQPELNESSCLRIEQSVTNNAAALFNISFDLKSVMYEIMTKADSCVTLPTYSELYTRVRTSSTAVRNPKTCQRMGLESDMNLIPAFIGTDTGALINSCVRQPVIAMGDGVYALTYLTMRGTCADHRHAVRHFEIGIVRRDAWWDPVLTPIHHFSEPGTPVLDGCSLVVKNQTALAFCTLTIDGPATDITNGAALGLALIHFNIRGEYSKHSIDPRSIDTQRQALHLVTLPGKAAIRKGILYSFGYMVTRNTEPGDSKCVTEECNQNNQEKCNTYSRTTIGPNKPRSMVLFQLDIGAEYFTVDKAVVVPRTQYYQLTSGDIFYTGEDNDLLYQLHNKGWYNKPIRGRLTIDNQVTLHEHTRTYDSLSTRETCNPRLGCPSSCEISSMASYFPLDKDFKSSVGVVALRNGMTPIVTYSTDDWRNHWKYIKNYEYESVESSLSCYSPDPALDDYVLCTTVMTAKLLGNTNPQLVTASWYQIDKCHT
uniref:Attachment glycoprotein n=1 Tax=Paramyxoviridae sp. TaxID=1663356 RepID=A0A858HUS6_9MONO|nr:attachment glycoprotein [Paramyxoviridae sp.]